MARWLLLGRIISLKGKSQLAEQLGNVLYLTSPVYLVNLVYLVYLM